jgi:hypothetical protein
MAQLPLSYTIKKVINICMASKSKLCASFLDNQKAFDTIWHDGLFLTLEELDVSCKIWISFTILINMHLGMCSKIGA